MDKLTGSLQVGGRAVSLAVKSFSRIDGLIINHGTLGEVKRIRDSTVEEWRSVFDVNFFSCVSFVSTFAISHGTVAMLYNVFFKTIDSYLYIFIQSTKRSTRSKPPSPHYAIIRAA